MNSLLHQDSHSLEQLLEEVKNVVCFTTKEAAGRAEKVKQLLHRLNTSGRVFLTPTVYDDMPCMRAALVNWRTTEEDVRITVEEIIRAYEGENGHNN